MEIRECDESREKGGGEGKKMGVNQVQGRKGSLKDMMRNLNKMILKNIRKSQRDVFFFCS